MEVLRLVPLASEALPHKILHTLTHVGKMKVTTKAMQRALDPSCPSSWIAATISCSSGDDSGMYSRPSKVMRPSVIAHGVVLVPAESSSCTATSAGSRDRQECAH